MNMEDNIVQQLMKDVSSIKAKLDMLLQEQMAWRLNNDKKLDDHEKRIRFLEKYAFIILGGVLLIEFVIRAFGK